MRKTKISDVPISDKILVTIPELASLTSSGRYTADKIAEQAGAVVYIGSRKFANTDIVKEFLKNISE